MRRTALLCFAVMVTLFALGCGSKSTTAPATAPSLSQSAEIRNFTLPNLNVSVGTTVAWTNSDGTSHTVTDKGGKFKSGVLADGQSFMHTFNDAGIFNYFCEIHPSLQATIIVKK